jgi:acyl carrier protein
MASKLNVLDTGTAPQQASALSAEERELAQLIVTTLNLEARPEEIAPQAPLFGGGLELDSIDILEIALAISKTYGIRLRSDDENNARIFSSLRSLNEHIRKLQTR